MSYFRNYMMKISTTIKILSPIVGKCVEKVNSEIKTRKEVKPHFFLYQREELAMDLYRGVIK